MATVAIIDALVAIGFTTRCSGTRLSDLIKGMDVDIEILGERLKKLRIEMAEVGADAMLVGSQFNRRWLSGFTGSYGWLLITETQAILATDFRYWDQAKAQAPHFTLFKLMKDRTNLDLIRSGGAQNIALEAQHITIREYENLQQVDGVAWKSTEDLVENLRMIKDAAELHAIRKAASITDAAMARVSEFVRPGMSELDLAWELEKVMREEGATGMTFPVHVASGPNAALPHHAPGERCIQPGEIVLVDMGASLDGYGSDLSRTFFFGEVPSPEFDERYAIVLEAQEAALEGMKPGMTGEQVDAIAREIIGDAGYADHFGHGLGHGLGLEGHEGPRLSTARASRVLEPGMVTTVEPGIYLPGWGGIRIEDLVLLTESGPQLLSHCEKSPHIAA